MSAIAATDPQHVGPPCSTSFTHWLASARPRAVVAIAQQRIRRAAWIAREHLSAYEAACIPLDFDPTPEHMTSE
jgi:hypothetical protein